MSKVRQRTQPLSCSLHKRNGCRAQAALPTMMSGLDGCLRADVTWVGEGAGEKEEESFYVCFSAAQCWRGTGAICCVLRLRKLNYYEPVVAIVGDQPYFEVSVGGKVWQRTQPLSCSRHERNGCKAHAQAALPTMMYGLDGCLRADVTWVGSGGKKGESFHVCFSAARCWLGTVAEQGSAWWARFVCLLFIGHTTFVHFAALPPSTPREQPSRRGRPRARGAGKHAQREHARACRTTSQRKNRCIDAFQKQNRTRARMLSYT